MTLVWEGDKIKLDVAWAQRFAINKTMAEAVVHAKNNHNWQNRTGILEGSIAISTMAIRDGRGFRGEWGSKDVAYALIHELGGRIVPKKAKVLRFKVDGQWRSAKEVTIPARPYLRPAADAVYPQLASNINLGLRLT
ncbi:hypothetical protein LCGC14_0746920 [marine sediment metagenome]|uniref:Uncharacterized protein n=1 Tax=marine sediment metagenome TaxID=412755 RepID=A0A0F9SQ49_9ZZZZ